MKLKKLLLRYYPPGIILQYDVDGCMKLKPLDLLDLTPDVDLEVGCWWLLACRHQGHASSPRACRQVSVRLNLLHVHGGVSNSCTQVFRQRCCTTACALRVGHVLCCAGAADTDIKPGATDWGEQAACAAATAAAVGGEAAGATALAV